MASVFRDMPRSMTTRSPGASPGSRTAELGSLAAVFLRLGFTGFGGPAAHIAMMEDEVVRRRGWLTREEFLDLVGASHLIPGPNSTELAIHIGRRRAGWAGLFIAGISFIIPAVLIVLACAWAYVRFGKLPQADGLLYGIKPVIIAIVLQALWSLGRTAIKSKLLAAASLVAAVLSILRVDELAILAGVGLVAAAVRRMGGASRSSAAPMISFLPAFRSPILAAAATGGAGVPFGVWPMFLFFLKVGSVLYGSGYVLLAFLRADLVERWGWLTEGELLDAVAIGQFTPGPVFTTATFIGYVLGGVPAALLATLGIFLPAFVFVAISGPLVPRIRGSPVAGAFLDGVNAASFALMAVVTWQLGAAALVDWLTVVMAAVAVVVLLRFRVNSAWLVLGGAAVGVVKTGWW
jgi:chromate transporter